jgi:hypothetical protein
MISRKSVFDLEPGDLVDLLSRGIARAREQALGKGGCFLAKQDGEYFLEHPDGRLEPFACDAEDKG